MTKLFGMGLIAFSLALASCGGGTKADTTASTSEGESAPPNADQNKVEKLEIDTDKSTVSWRGYILGMKEHTGTLKFKQGSINVSGGEITGGGLVVDMTSMATTDDNYDAEHPAEGLIGHLSSPDFFDVAKYSVATLGFKGDGKTNLTVRDKTHEEQYTDLKVKQVDGQKVYTGKMEFDRQKYGVAFSGPAQDVVISDDIELEVTLYTK